MEEVKQMGEKFYEVEGAVFRRAGGGPLEIFHQKEGKWLPYEGDAGRVLQMSHPMSAEEVRPYMEREPAEAEKAE